MTKKTNISRAILYVSMLAFISFAVYLLYLNQEVLYTAHDRSEFLYGAPFYCSLLSKPFGLMQYVGAWLTQLCYYPTLGACILILIWGSIFYVGTKAFRLQGSASALMLLPVACLLTSIVDLGYWIYIFSIRGYWFSQSVGYLLMLLLLWAASSTPRKWHLVWYLVGFALYPVLGWFALLFVICLVVTGKPTWRELLAIILVLFTAAIWRALLYSDQKLADVALAGFPQFVTPVEHSDQLSIPFWVLGAISILIPLFRYYLNHGIVPVLCAVSAIAFCHVFMFNEPRYIDEMHMVRYAESDDWKGVLQVATENHKPTTTMVMLRNIALMNEGGLLDRSFKLGNSGVDVYHPDTLHISMMNIAAPLVYYNYGKMNYATRLSFENTVATGLSPFYMKLLWRCADATGEKNLAGRYRKMLQHNLFYEHWHPAPITNTVKELNNSFDDEINGVENDSERYIINSFSHSADTVSQVASEQALFYSMIRRDSRCFWASLRKFVKLHPGGKFPLHAQEAYIMYLDKAPEEKRMMLPVEQEVYDRYKLFWETLGSHVKTGVKLEDVGVKMQAEWADTYWWYNIFGRKL